MPSNQTPAGGLEQDLGAQDTHLNKDAQTVPGSPSQGSREQPWRPPDRQGHRSGVPWVPAPSRPRGGRPLLCLPQALDVCVRAHVKQGLCSEKKKTSLKATDLN